MIYDNVSDIVIVSAIEYTHIGAHRGGEGKSRRSPLPGK